MLDWVKSLAGRAIENAAGQGLWLLIVTVAIGLYSVIGNRVDVPAWAFALCLFLLFAFGVTVGRSANLSADQEYLEFLEWQHQFGGYYAEHLLEGLEALERIVTGAISGVSIEEYIQRGILDPARDWLAQGDGEEIRLSILVVDETSNEWFMRFAAGHSLEGKQKFRLAVAGSFAGHALSSGEIQIANDVDSDPRFATHPYARDGRAYGSLISVPISVGDNIVAVLNVISTMKNAFSPVEITYIGLLGSLLDLAWGLGDV